MELLKLGALDADDLAVISVHMQDALVRVGDIRHVKRLNKLVLVVNRFDWETAAARTGQDAKSQRRPAGLQFARVKAIKAHKIRQGAPNAVLSLLTIAFVPGADPPEGTIELIFSGGGAIRLDVECIEVTLEDLGPAWESARVPTHDQEP
jgi:hypothetical protein